MLKQLYIIVFVLLGSFSCVFAIALRPWLEQIVPPPRETLRAGQIVKITLPSNKSGKIRQVNFREAVNNGTDKKTIQFIGGQDMEFYRSTLEKTDTDRHYEFIVPLFAPGKPSNNEIWLEVVNDDNEKYEAPFPYIYRR